MPAREQPAEFAPTGGRYRDVVAVCRLLVGAGGVVGMPGVQISSELSNATNGTVLVSGAKDIRLDSGTQMVLRVAGQQPQP